MINVEDYFQQINTTSTFDSFIAHLVRLPLSSFYQSIIKFENHGIVFRANILQSYICFTDDASMERKT